MDCTDAQELLLRSEVRSAGPLADHLAGCAACAGFAVELDQLEEAWRSIPLPVDSGRGREKFLGFLPLLEPPIPVESRKPRPIRRWLVAATLLLGIGLWGGVLLSGRRASASTDVVERLVYWNLNLARVESADERFRLYSDRVPAMVGEVERAELPEGDRELAKTLLVNAPWLVRNVDPLAAADRFNDLADQLLHRMSTANGGGDENRVARYARLYHRVVELGIVSKYDVLEQSAALDFERQRRIERLVLRDADRMQTLVHLLEQAPDASRKEIKKALGISRRLKTAEARTTRKARGKSPKPAAVEKSDSK